MERLTLEYKFILINVSSSSGRTRRVSRAIDTRDFHQLKNNPLLPFTSNRLSSPDKSGVDHHFAETAGFANNLPLLLFVKSS